MRNLKKILRLLAGILLAVLLLIIAAFCYLTVTEFHPPKVLSLYSSVKPYHTIRIDDTLSLVDWNIGYAGLGANMDFFYEGGAHVYDTRAHTLRNIKGISSFLKANDMVNFVFIQEVDRNSKRTYHEDEFAIFDSTLSQFRGYYAMNYKTPFVPVPLRKPMGKVESGIAVYSKIQPISVKRHSYPGNYAWPKRLFMLKRCFMVLRFELNNGKQFVLINTHNSAYDDGRLRLQQTRQLAAFVKAEYRRGNYVVVGGDWNQCPPDFKPHFKVPFDTLFRSYLPRHFLPGWKKVFSDTVPTNRNVSKIFNPVTSFRTVIDFFIISPNMTEVSYNIEDLGFRYSDHQPVRFSFTFKH